MLKLIKKLLEKSGYSFVSATETPEVTLFLKSMGKSEAGTGFIILPMSESDVSEVLVDTQADIAQWLQTLPNYEGVEKNCILILLLEHKKDEEEIGRVVSEIEEDQYFFKKQVVFYSGTEINTLLEYLDSAEPIESLDKILYDRKRFSAYSNGEPDDLYPLAARLYSKLPFLNVRKSALVLPNLAAEIQVQLEEAGLVGLREEMLSMDSNDTDISNWLKALMEVE